MPFTDAMQCRRRRRRPRQCKRWPKRKKETSQLYTLYYSTYTHKVRRACTCSAAQRSVVSIPLERKMKMYNSNNNRLNPAHTHTHREREHVMDHTLHFHEKYRHAQTHCTHHTHTVQFNSNSFRFGLAFSHLAPLIDQGKRKGDY